VPPFIHQRTYILRDFTLCQYRELQRLDSFAPSAGNDQKRKSKLKGSKSEDFNLLPNLERRSLPTFIC
jgi:hypothetical protein